MTETIRLTTEQAARLVATYCDDTPPEGAVARAVDHEWVHDPRVAVEHAAAQDERDAVLYGPAETETPYDLSDPYEVAEIVATAIDLQEFDPRDDESVAGVVTPDPRADLSRISVVVLDDDLIVVRRDDDLLRRPDGTVAVWVDVEEAADEAVESISYA